MLYPPIGGGRPAAKLIQDSTLRHENTLGTFQIRADSSMCAYMNFDTMASMETKNITRRASDEISLADELLIGSLFTLVRHQLTPNQILALEEGDELILVLEMMDLLFPSRAGDANAAILSEYCGVEI